jgi:hypothetical protein
VTARRFAVSIAAALALHGLALSLLHPPLRGNFSAPRAPLEVRLLPAKVQQAEVHYSAPIPVLSPAREGRPGVLAVSRPSGAPAPFAAAPESSAAHQDNQPESPPAAIRYREAARAIIREEARRPPESPAPPPVETPEARLARAWNGPPPGEKRLDGGILKITTRQGTTYCLKPPDATYRDGPGEHYAIAVTCP